MTDRASATQAQIEQTLDAANREYHAKHPALDAGNVAITALFAPMYAALDRQEQEIARERAALQGMLDALNLPKGKTTGEAE